MLKKIEKKCARIAQRAKNAAHAEKLKKCRIFVRRTIAFFPRVYTMRLSYELPLNARL